MRPEPKVRPDGLCARCKKPRVSSRRKGHEGTSVEAGVWEISVSRDPFCSRRCCETFHGLAEDQQGTCEGCGKKFLRYRTQHKFCSTACSIEVRDQRKRARLANDPLLREHYRAGWRASARKRRQQLREAA